MRMTLRDIVQDTARMFERCGSSSPRLDAEVLIAHALGFERYRLMVDGGREISESEREKIGTLAARRSSGEPVAYITGMKEFYSIDFRVTPDVLVPRPETELLVDLALFYAPRNGSMLEIGTGSGAIAISVKRNRPDIRVVATDISERALDVAVKNSDTVLGPAAITFACGDMYAPIGSGTFDIIVSNPPYIEPAMRCTLQRELSYEPYTALYAEDGGMAAIRAIIDGAAAHCEDGGVIILEIGADQAGRVREEGELHGYDLSFFRDYAGFQRVALLKMRK